jgi:2,3-bisphosphoglycerate-independent phosphoglycerate mutase
MKPLVLLILDGFGHSEHREGNAVALAEMPNWRRLLHIYPQTLLSASGLAVGLPEGQMGNSEVGHMNIGVGRVVYQDLTKLDLAVEDGSLAQNPVILAALEQAHDRGGAVHFLGLLSDGGVHSHERHLHALVRLAAARGIKEVYVHVITDGRDVLPHSSDKYVARLEALFAELGTGNIATVCGRYFLLDRDRRWERVEQGYDLLTSGLGAVAATANAAIQRSWEKDVTDEFIEPTRIRSGAEDGKGLIKEGDSVICYNFRADRMREITEAFIKEDWSGFVRKTHPHVHYVCLTEYDDDFTCPIAYPPTVLADTLTQVLSRAGLKQLRLAETEKYAHVTFFFNGGIEEPEKLEDRLLIPSPKVATYDLQPEMSAVEVTDAALARWSEYDVMIINLANPDMVGHTGVLSAAIKAVETVDTCLGRLEAKLQAAGGTLLVTADHGNAEQMTDPETGSPYTAHTTNPVPFVLIGSTDAALREGVLADIAPTILELLGLPQPAAMTGKSLLIS